MNHWTELAEGVLVRRHDELDLSTGLVVGTERALVVDTRGDREQGAELAEAVRRVTRLPWQVAVTHAHFDHCFGTTAFRPASVWAHRDCAPHLHRTAATQRTDWAEHYRRHGRPEVADSLVGTEPVPPDHEVRGSAELDLGGRTVRLLCPGLGHTDHDLAVHVPDSGVVFAGDLVENGAAPSFEDSFPTEWPSTLDVLWRLRPSTVVPGHGDPVTLDFVAAQREEIASLAGLCRAVTSGTISTEQAVVDSPFPAETTRTALRRCGG